MAPDWLGSPQHFAGGAFVAVVAVVVARRAGVREPLLLFALAVGAASFAEIVVELAEYFLRVAHATAYHDTIADLAATLAGGVVGAAAAVAVGSRRSIYGPGSRGRRRGGSGPPSGG